MSKENLIGTSVSLGALLVYWYTLAPSVGFVDSGELASVCATLGIAHPTGYPLFTLVGWIFAHLPFGASVIYRLNFMAAISSALGIFFFFKLLLILQRTLEETSGGAGVGIKKEDLHLFCSASVSLVLGFSETYWSQALAVEVYSLQSFLFMLILFLFVLALTSAHERALEEGEAPRIDEGRWMVVGFVLGLGFANHMTTVFLIPAFGVLYFERFGVNVRSFARIGKMVLPFLLALSLYTYLPLRAAAEPSLNWGDPSTLERVIRHLTAQQYRVWMFSSLEVAQRQLKYLLDSVLPEFGYVPILFAPFGLWKLFRQGRRVLLFTVLLFVFCVAYSINYDIHDIDSYFLLAYAMIGIWIFFGTTTAVHSIGSKRSAHFTVPIGVLALTLVPVFSHFQGVSKRENYLVKDYTFRVLDSVEPNGIVLSYQWDIFVSPSIYFQSVEGVRPDVVIIDKELLRRSWYVKQLGRTHPWLIKNSEKEVDSFLREVYKFEHSLPYDANIIEARYIGMINSFLENNFSDRPIYVSYEIERQFGPNFQRVPSGMLFRLYADSIRHPIRLPNFPLPVFEGESRDLKQLRRAYSMLYAGYGRYFYRTGDLPDAAKAFEISLVWDGSSREARYWLDRIKRERAG